MPPYTPIVTGSGSANHPLTLTGAGDSAEHPIELSDDEEDVTIDRLLTVCGLITLCMKAHFIIFNSNNTN